MEIDLGVLDKRDLLEPLRKGDLRTYKEEEDDRMISIKESLRDKNCIILKTW